MQDLFFPFRYLAFSRYSSRILLLYHLIFPRRQFFSSWYVLTLYFNYTDTRAKISLLFLVLIYFPIVNL